MNGFGTAQTVSDFLTLARFRGRLLQKFVAIFTSVVCIALLAFALLDVLFFIRTVGPR